MCSASVTSTTNFHFEFHVNSYTTKPTDIGVHYGSVYVTEF